MFRLGAGEEPAERAMMSAYLDYAASTPVLPQASAALAAALAHAGNPSSVHRHGQAARAVVETAREQLAAVLACDPIEIVFTSGGTESVNLAVVGLYRAAIEADAARNVIVVPEAEHHATLDTVLWLQNHEGARLQWLPVDREARIDTAALAAVLEREAGNIALVTALWANNEVGTIQPVAELAALAATHRVPLHLDAVAAFGHDLINFTALRGDAQGSTGLVALSVSGHKIGSVPGVGALVVARQAGLKPLIHGGGQERGLRSGTLDAPAIASFGAAAEAMAATQGTEHVRLTALRDALIGQVAQLVPDAALRGSASGRLNNNVNFTFPGCQSDSLLFLLDEAGVSVSTGSACQAGVAQPSHVLLAMGLDEAGASSALRFTIGHGTTQADLDAVIEALPQAHERALAAGRTV
jgi:cysteine desulfurase